MERDNFWQLQSARAWRWGPAGGGSGQPTRIRDSDDTATRISRESGYPDERCGGRAQNVRDPDRGETRRREHDAWSVDVGVLLQAGELATCPPRKRSKQVVPGPYHEVPFCLSPSPLRHGGSTSSCGIVARTEAVPACLLHIDYRHRHRSCCVIFACNAQTRFASWGRRRRLCERYGSLARPVRVANRERDERRGGNERKQSL